MRVFHHQDVEAKLVRKGASGTRVRWLVTSDMGAENFAMRLFEMEVGGYSPFHSHNWEHEIFILEGEGLVVGEESERRFKAGDVIFIAPNEKHQLKNNGDKAVRFICLVPYTDEYVRAFDN